MDIERVASAGVEPVVDEQHVQWELEGYVTGHYAILGDYAVRDDLLPDEASRPRWEITSLGAADWAMQQLARIEAVAREYDAEIARWTKLRANVARAGEFFRGHLERWAVSQRTDKRKSFPLAHGTVSTREAKPAPEIVDQEAAVAWCKVNAPDAIKVEESVLISRVPGLRIADVVQGWSFVSEVGEACVVAGEIEDPDGTVEPVHVIHLTSEPPPMYLTCARVLRDVLAEHATPLHLAADTIEAEWVRTRLVELTGCANVSAIVMPAVVDASGLPADGFGVRPGKVSSSVAVS